MVNFTSVPGERSIGDIRVFALSTCGWCRKTKAFFTARGIRFSYVDMDLLEGDELAEAKLNQRHFNPRGSFPTIVINNADCIVGYDEQRLLDLIGE